MNSMKQPEEQIGDDGDADEEKDHFDERTAMPSTIERDRSGVEEAGSITRPLIYPQNSGRSRRRPGRPNNPWQCASAKGAENTPMCALAIVLVQINQARQ